jgi:hypothetical protein
VKAPQAITDMQLTAVRTLTGVLAAPQLQASVSGITATLSWAAPVPTGQSIIAGYRLYKGPTAGGPFTLVTTTTATSLPDTLPGTQFYRVEAFDQYQTGNTSAVVGCSPATGQPVKWHPGHYMGSNNINGSVTRGNGRNQNEMNILASSGANVLGYQPIYTWDVCELSDGGYDFTNIIEDFNYLQSVAPGKRFGPMIWCEKFTGTGFSGLGTPAYILNNSIYGAGSDGVHFGYWNQDFGSGQSGACAAIWRANVNDRYTRMFEHLATTSFVTTSGPYAGQTFTFDTHPLVEFIFNQETSLNLQAGSDYNSTNFANNFNTQVQRMVAAFPHTLVGPQINFVIANALTINGIVDNLAIAGPAVAMSCPDVYPTASGGFPTIGQNVYMGNRWNGSGFTAGGTDYRNSIPCIGFAQQATYTHFPTKTPADNFASAQTLRCSYFLWTYVVGTNYDWSSKIRPFIDANPITNTAYPANFPQGSGPPAVTGFRISQQGNFTNGGLNPTNNVITMVWNASAGATSYVVQRGVNGGAKSDYATLGNVLTYTDSAATNAYSAQNIGEQGGAPTNGTGPTTVYDYDIIPVGPSGRGSAPADCQFWFYQDGTLYAFSSGADLSGPNTCNYADTTLSPPTGSADIAVTLGGVGGYIQPPSYSPGTWIYGMECGAFNYLNLTCKPIDSTQQWLISIHSRGTVGDIGGPFIVLNLLNYGPAPVAGQWKTYKVPLVDLGFGVCNFTGSITGGVLTASGNSGCPMDSGGWISWAGQTIPTQIQSTPSQSGAGTYGVSGTTSQASIAMQYHRSCCYKMQVKSNTGTAGSVFGITNVYMSRS